MKLTTSQRKALSSLIELQEQYGWTRWTASIIGQTNARSLRSLDGTNLIEIDKRKLKYRYSITDTGRAALKEKAGEEEKR